jgi:hypothetical protein
MDGTLGSLHARSHCSGDSRGTTPIPWYVLESTTFGTRVRTHVLNTSCFGTRGTRVQHCRLTLTRPHPLSFANLTMRGTHTPTHPRSTLLPSSLLLLVIRQLAS